MRHERLFTGLNSAVLAVFITLGSMGCLLTGLDLQVYSFSRLVLLWSGAAMLFSLLYSRRNGSILLLCLFSFGAGYLLWRGKLIRQAEAMAVQISYLYDSVYHWGVLLFPEEIRNVRYVDQPIALWGIALEVPICRSISRRKPAFSAVFLSTIPLMLCLVTGLTVPELWALFLLLAGLSVLLITENVRRESAAQGNRLTLWIAVPALTVPALLFLIFPQSHYINHSAQIRDAIAEQAMKVMELLPENSETPQIPHNEIARDRINLSALDGQNLQEIPIMQVSAENSGTLYLRGQAFDVYTRTGWESTSGRSEDLSGWGAIRDHVTVRTFQPHEMLYVPNYPESGIAAINGMVPNTERLLQYSFTLCTDGSAAEEGLLNRCLKLPEETRKWAEKMIPQSGNTTAEQAQHIGVMVRASAVYDRAAGRMPAGEPDFAQWFLTESDTGYCVHFATAATVLLRASGIPARYITGYKAEMTAGEDTVVTSLDAHAWAEYYDTAAGCWRVLEATPADSAEEAEASEPVQKPTEAPRETTPASAAPTEPEETVPQKSSVGSVKRIIRKMLAGAILILLVLLQRTVRLALRALRLRRSSPNRQAILLWKESEQLAKLLKSTPPETLSMLAQKACYSPYTLTEEELALFELYRQKCIEQLNHQNPLKKWICRYVFAIK